MKRLLMTMIVCVACMGLLSPVQAHGRVERATADEALTVV